MHYNQNIRSHLRLEMRTALAKSTYPDVTRPRPWTFLGWATDLADGDGILSQDDALSLARTALRQALPNYLSTHPGQDDEVMEVLIDEALEYEAQEPTIALLVDHLAEYGGVGGMVAWALQAMAYHNN